VWCLALKRNGIKVREILDEDESEILDDDKSEKLDEDEIYF